MASTGESYVAIDLGAESGRVMLGTWSGESLELKEVYRFANGGVQLGESLYWDPLHLWQEMLTGIGRAAQVCTGRPVSIGIDTWGVDFGLVDRQGELLGLPHHHRDLRTEGILAELYRTIDAFELYRAVGSSGFAFNTLCQLYAMRRQDSAALGAAHRLLMMPDLFNYWLCGRQACETTIAGSTGFFDITSATWHRALLERLGLPAALLGEIVPAATLLGPLRPNIAEELGLAGPKPVQVNAPACHDTLSAIAAVPAIGQAYTAISSGTWSVIGKEIDEPILTRAAMDGGFLNEAGGSGKILLAMNSTGLWPLQECKRKWRQQGHPWSYADLTDMASEVKPFGAVLDPNAPELVRAGHMTDRIAAFYARTRQAALDGPGAIARALFEGLALRYRKAIVDLDRLTGRRTEMIYIVGGGSRNALLAQFTADATSLPVMAGPAEATIIGNILLQAVALGRLDSPDEARRLAASCSALRQYDPHPSTAWDDAYAIFLRVSEDE